MAITVTKGVVVQASDFHLKTHKEVPSLVELVSGDVTFTFTPLELYEAIRAYCKEAKISVRAARGTGTRKRKKKTEEAA